jgi:hypothetical protein
VFIFTSRSEAAPGRAVCGLPQKFYGCLPCWPSTQPVMHAISFTRTTLTFHVLDVAERMCC